MSIHGLFDQRVSLEPKSHRYYDDKGLEYMSVSKFLKMLGDKFEDSFAYKRADEATREAWAKKRDDAAAHGTRIHNVLETYNQFGYVDEADKEFEPLAKSVISQYEEYHKTVDEVCLFSPEYRIAGTTDKICVVTKTKDCRVDLADFKTNGMGIDFSSKYHQSLHAPLSHLQDCNYIKYSIQLSLYAYFWEELTGRTVRKLFLHFIPPQDPMAHHKIPVMYMKNDVKLILDAHKQDILDELAVKEKTEENEIFEF